MELPTRAKERRLRLLPKEMKSNTLIEDPRRVTP
jgi:hypothetical protein